MQFKGLTPNLRKAISNCPLIIGVAPNAWPRLVASYFFPQFKILCYRDRQDNDLIESRGIEAFSLRKNDPRFKIETLSASFILDSKPAKDFLQSQSRPFGLLVYKATPRLQKVAKKAGWPLIAVPAEIKNHFEDKRIFKEVIRKLGLISIPGESLKIEALTEARLVEYQKKFGQKKVVLQMAEVTYGGGSGTLFLDHPSELKLFRQRVKEIRAKLKGKKKQIKIVNIAPFIEGSSPSLSCCATRHGVLIGPLQTQIIDMAEVGTRKKNRSGNYAGHDWSFRRYSSSLQEQARKIAKGFGEHLYQKGYRGIFGLDFVIDEKTQKVYPVECNPRFTDAFPTFSFLLMAKGLLPMDIFHILELLDQDYELDFGQLNRAYQQPLEGGQIILHNPLGDKAVSQGILRAGVYCLENDQLQFLRSGLTPFDLQNKNEFLFTEGLAKKPGDKLPDTGRLCRLIRKGGFLETESRLKPEVKQVIKLAYKEFKIVKKQWRKR